MTILSIYCDVAAFNSFAIFCAMFVFVFIVYFSFVLYFVYDLHNDNYNFHDRFDS